MKLEKILSVMRKEYLCVKRNEDKCCDRKCENCDLVLPTEDVLTAFREIIEDLEYQIKRIKG